MSATCAGSVHLRWGITARLRRGERECTPRWPLRLLSLPLLRPALLPLPLAVALPLLLRLHLLLRAGHRRHSAVRWALTLATATPSPAIGKAQSNCRLDTWVDLPVRSSQHTS